MTDLTTPLRVMIADDEVPARNRMRELLADCSEKLPVEVVGEAGSGQELLDALQQSPADVVFLDIRMPDMDGIETARHLQSLATPPRIVFTTAYDTYAVKAFELHAIDYLLKPIRGRRLLDSLERASGALSPRQDVLEGISRAPRTHIAVQERGRVVLVPVKDIRFLRSELKYVTIRTADREFLVEDSLTRLEQEFAGTFVRIHRSCLVARAYLTGFERQETASSDSAWLAVIEGVDEPLPVSRRQAHVIRDFGKGS